MGKNVSPPNRQTAVHRDRRAVQVRARIEAQPGHAVADLLGACHSARGDVTQDRGERRLRSSPPISSAHAVSGVSTSPGQTALTLIPRSAYSIAAVRVSPRMPCLATE